MQFKPVIMWTLCQRYADTITDLWTEQSNQQVEMLKGKCNILQLICFHQSQIQ